MGNIKLANQYITDNSDINITFFILFTLNFIFLEEIQNLIKLK